ncbi:hypothetical protein GCM10028868_02610 [Virgibacillus kimchii]
MTVDAIYNGPVYGETGSLLFLQESGIFISISFLPCIIVLNHIISEGLSSNYSAFSYKGVP